MVACQTTTRADRIPPELFANILRHLPGEVSSHTPWQSRKRLLGTCALTCRCWATHIRPFIFSSLTLRTREDMQSFLDMMNQKTFQSIYPPVRELVKDLYLLQTVPSDPWIPLLLNFTPRATLTNLERIDLLTSRNVVAGDSDDGITARSLYYQDFPTALPAAHIWRLSRHSITSIHFRAFKDALAVITSFDSAVTDCVGLTWLQGDSVSPTSPPASVRTAPRWAGVDKVIRVQGCTAVWPFFWCVVTTRRSSRPGSNKPLFVEQTHLPTMLRIVQCVADLCTCSRCAVPGARDAQLYRIGKYIDPDDRSSSLRLTVNKGEFEVHTLTFRIESSGVISRVVLTIDLEPIITSFSSRKEGLASSLDWTSLDEHAFTLGTSMTNFTIEIQAINISTVRRFVSTVKAKMQRLASADRLVFRHRAPGSESYSNWNNESAGGDASGGTSEEQREEVPDWYLKW